MNEDFDTSTEPTLIFPPPPQLSSHVPAALRGDFEEAWRCFRAKAFIATAVMVRRVVEGACDECGFKKKSIYQAIEAMKEAGLLGSRLADCAHQLRILGNDGAHPTKLRISKKEAQAALIFIEALLDQVFVLDRLLGNFERQTESRKEWEEILPGRAG